MSYSNVIATIALFIALGGSAYALSRDTVESKHIVNGEVASSDLENDGVKSKDVRDGDLAAEDVGENVLGGEQIDESTLYPNGGGTGQNPYSVPISGVTTAQARNIGVGGDTTYASISGRAVTEPTFQEAATATGRDTLEFGELRVKLAATLAAGQSRTFTVIRDFDFVGSPTVTSVACTIAAGEDECLFAGRTQSNNAFIAMRIESTGAGLVGTDDAYFGMATRMIADE
jgi:hypothetical protein